MARAGNVWRLPQPLKKRKLRRAYRTLCESPAGRVMLADLRRTCFADYPTFLPDDPHGRKSAYREGMRTVYLRIIQYGRLSDADLAATLATDEEDEDEHE